MDNNEEIYDAEIISESVVTDEEYNGRVIEEPSDYWKLVAFHLQNNHQPSIPLSMVDTCIRAIEYANDGDFNTLLHSPKELHTKALTPPALKLSWRVTTCTTS